MGNNTLSDKAFAKTKNTVLSYQSTPRKGQSLPNRRINDATSPAVVSQSYPFQTTQKFNTEDGVYNVSVNAGQVVLPDSQELLPIYEFDREVDTGVYIYIKISGTQTGSGGFENITAVIEESLIEQINTDSVNYFLVSYIIVNIINQERFTSFDSGGNIY